MTSEEIDKALREPTSEYLDGDGIPDGGWKYHGPLIPLLKCLRYKALFLGGFDSSNEPPWNDHCVENIRISPTYWIR